MTNGAVGLDRIGQILVAVKDLERAVAFYRDVLGLRFLFQFPGMAFFDCGGIRLYLTTPDSAEIAATSIIYYRVSAIEDTARTLEARGVRFIQPPRLVHEDAAHELWLAFFVDSEDNRAALMSEVPKEAGAGLAM
jgi:methylmalonyl-CoA/ethylmalonyl-CoA epimerase